MSRTVGPEPGSGSELAPVSDADRLYFPELDGLRFVAFLSVFLFHGAVGWLELSRWVGSAGARYVRENGWVGVQLFFILSGYLITTLLLRERRDFGRVDLPAFFVRRVLRIWPLYYLTVFLTFLVIPALYGSFVNRAGFHNLERHLPAFLVFGGNWSMIARGPVGWDSQSILWSVCVEEQFYLVVPFLVAWLPGTVRAGAVAGLIAGSVAFRHSLARAGVPQFVLQYNTFAQFDTLLSGVLLALLLGPDPRRRVGVGRALRWLQWPIYAYAAWVFSRPTLGHVETWKRTWDFVAVWLAGVGIVATAVTVPGGLRWALARPGLVRLGKISYGLYMFHEIFLHWRKGLSLAAGWFPFDELIWPAAALAATVGLARLSYERFERPFLARKRAWTRVPSRPV